MGGRLDAGANHTCAVLADANVRCWGFGADGQLGYGNENNIGDDETPGSVGPVDLGGTAKAISAGDSHTCALLADGNVRCWGFGANGRLGDRSTKTIGDDETPASVGPVNLGSGRTATAITSGAGHTCALLDDGKVRCWGFAGGGQLGYGNTENIGDDETPASVGPVNLGRSATAISAGTRHTCALLDDGTVRCWGYGVNGELGYGNQNNIGDGIPDVDTDGDGQKDTETTPESAGPVNLGGAPAKAISAGQSHTCALLVDGNVRCWGSGNLGRLGYGAQETIGDDETPASVGPVSLGRSAVAISAGQNHTCALLDDGSVRCWGYGGEGRLGYVNASNIGDDETPASVGPASLGRTATAISAGGRHTCARLDDANVRCWGYGREGRLGYCNQSYIGDDETPGSAGPVDLGAGGAFCSRGGLAATPATSISQGAGADLLALALAVQARRARDLRSCLAAVVRRASRERTRARHGAARQRARAMQHMRLHRNSGRRRCLRLHGRTPGHATGLAARGVSKTKVLLSFLAPGTDGARAPAARSYLIKQSPSPIRSARSFNRAQSLCGGRCRFSVTRPGTRLELTISDLRPRRTYYYAVVARDNVSSRRGPRTQPIRARTR